jgi:crotonobetainyl-CoA:carnitine CoA-transferase CaiB-like acyl-CoA transferase
VLGAAVRRRARNAVRRGQLGEPALAFDLRRGRDVLLRLIDGADVFVQSLRPVLAA